MAELYFTTRSPLPASNCAFPSADLNPHLIHGSLGPSKSSTQTASQLVQPFLHSSPQCVPILYNGLPLLRSKLPLRMGESGGPHLTQPSSPQPIYTRNSSLVIKLIPFKAFKAPQSLYFRGALQSCLNNVSMLSCNSSEIFNSYFSNVDIFFVGFL